MKTRFKSLALAATGAWALSSLAAAAELTVTISDFRDNQGQLLVSVVDSEAGWNNQAKPVAAQQLVVADKIGDSKSLQLKFTLPAGKYAVQVLHDANSNGELDFNEMGIPKESYGSSNNPVVMRRPYFSETVFELKDASTDIAVRLQ